MIDSSWLPLVLAMSEAQYRWTKIGVLLFFFLFFLGVLIRVLSRSPESYEADARIVFDDTPSRSRTTSNTNSNPSRS